MNKEQKCCDRLQRFVESLPPRDAKTNYLNMWKNKDVRFIMPQASLALRLDDVLYLLQTSYRDLGPLSDTLALRWARLLKKCRDDGVSLT